MARNNSGYYRGTRQRVRKREGKMGKRQFKATRKLGGGRKTFRGWGMWDEGDVLVGKYVDSFEDNYQKTCWVIEVIEASFKDKKLGAALTGKNLGLNSAGMLDKAMKKATLGSIVQITYNGTSTIEKGKYAGKDSHVIEVEEVEEDGDDVADDNDYPTPDL